MATPRGTTGRARFERAVGASQEGGSAVVNCAKTTKSGGECRSLSRSITSAARDLRPREDDSEPIEWPRHAEP